MSCCRVVFGLDGPENSPESGICIKNTHLYLDLEIHLYLCNMCICVCQVAVYEFGWTRESPGEPSTICKRQPSIKEAKMKIDIVNKKKIKVNILKVEVWKAKVTPIPLPTKK